MLGRIERGYTFMKDKIKKEKAPKVKKEKAPKVKNEKAVQSPQDRAELEAAIKGFTSSGVFKALVALFVCSLVFTMFSSSILRLAAIPGALKARAAAFASATTQNNNNTNNNNNQNVFEQIFQPDTTSASLDVQGTTAAPTTAAPTTQAPTKAPETTQGATEAPATTTTTTSRQAVRVCLKSTTTPCSAHVKEHPKWQALGAAHPRGTRAGNRFTAARTS